MEAWGDVHTDRTVLYSGSDDGYEIGVRAWSANMRADHFLVFGRTIAGRKAGPAIQSSQRERNPKGSRWLLCAKAVHNGIVAGRILAQTAFIH